MNEEEIRDIELAKKINKIIYYDFKDDIKNDIFIVLDTLVNTTELKDLSATQTLIKNQYYRIQNEKEKHLEKIIQDQQSELEKKDQIIDEMAGYISYCFNEDEGICKKSASAINYQSYYCDNNCKKCIKQHFERKVEND